MNRALTALALVGVLSMAAAPAAAKNRDPVTSTTTVAIVATGTGWTCFDTRTPSWPNSITLDPQPTWACFYASLSANPDFGIGLGNFGGGYPGETYARIQAWDGASPSTPLLVDGADFTPSSGPGDGNLYANAASADYVRITLWVRGRATCYKIIESWYPWTTLAVHTTTGICP